MTGLEWRPAVTAAARQARTDPDIRQRVGLWLCDCLVRVLPAYELEHPDDDRVRRGVAAARQVALGQARDDARLAARSRVHEAEDGAQEYALATAALVADALADDALNRAPWLAYQAAKIAAGQLPAVSAQTALSVETTWQLQRLVMRLGTEP